MMSAMVFTDKEASHLLTLCGEEKVFLWIKNVGRQI
jgi:hypothetical protein